MQILCNNVERKLISCKSIVMALVHWDKSVLTLHLKEMMEDHQRGDRTALLGLGAIVMGTVFIPATVKLGKPLLKSMIKSSLYLSSSIKKNHS